MAGGYETRDRPRRDPHGAGVALINTAGRGRGGPGRGGRGDNAGRGGRGGRGEQDKRNKKDDGGSNNEGREFSNVNNDG